MHKNTEIAINYNFQYFKWISFCCKSISLIFAMQELLILNFPWINYKQVFFVYFCVFQQMLLKYLRNKIIPCLPSQEETLLLLALIKLEIQCSKWCGKRIKADRVDIVVLCNSSGKRSFGSDFKERTLVDCSDQANSMIVIQNFTASDFATYRCVATGRNKTYVMSFTVVGK